MEPTRDDIGPRKRTVWRLKATLFKTVLWCLLGSWLGWMVCSIIALSGSSERSPAGSSGGMIAIDVLVMALKGDSSVHWALVGCRAFGGVMVTIILGLFILYMSARKTNGAQRPPSA
ncbi:hypothetical protein ACQHIV_04090 [Kribbella sp. GL6]|uniref:hypothetical protein n=1 Tax=Kribbella sp. GL6 TaxID=3419765 RepID=UPI003CFF2430